MLALNDFVQAELDGSCWSDATYRGYDLDFKYGKWRVRRALTLLGYSYKKDLAMCLEDAFKSNGLDATKLRLHDFHFVLGRWWIYRQLSERRISKWKYRKLGKTEACKPT